MYELLATVCRANYLILVCDPVVCLLLAHWPSRRYPPKRSLPGWYRHLERINMFNDKTADSGAQSRFSRHGQMVPDICAFLDGFPFLLLDPNIHSGKKGTHAGKTMTKKKNGVQQMGLHAQT
jgi:hypothetical protein